MPGMLARPPAIAAEDSCWLPCSRKAPGWARRLLRDLLADVEDGHLYAKAGELLLSELVTNAVEHARIPGRLLWIRLELRVGSLRIEVHDASTDRPALRRAAHDDEVGRGLLLVQALAQQWGCRPRAGGIGKLVWCEVGPTARAAANLARVEQENAVRGMSRMGES